MKSIAPDGFRGQQIKRLALGWLGHDPQADNRWSQSGPDVGFQCADLLLCWYGRQRIKE